MQLLGLLGVLSIFWAAAATAQDFASATAALDARCYSIFGCGWECSAKHGGGCTLNTLQLRKKKLETEGEMQEELAEEQRQEFRINQSVNKNSTNWIFGPGRRREPGRRRFWRPVERQAEEWDLPFTGRRRVRYSGDPDGYSRPGHSSRSASGDSRVTGDRQPTSCGSGDCEGGSSRHASRSGPPDQYHGGGHAAPTGWGGVPWTV